ncbi:lipocalin family protein [Loktanella sp. S4079]|uniref:lipocalin family protein n=1 Tax=Loktanella sp. S4079 TaxID=579483 RepID=UPI0005FA128A|nr:lipocalin family protein [Loktanella sp. S4079]KJZ19674.1 lipocalin [Loktanella sp. S4079]
MRYVFALLMLAACTPAPVYRDPTVTISSQALFDPARYAGLWHEVARFPNAFERDCVTATAEYGLRADGLLSVLNICRSADGTEISRINGNAEITGPGRLVVRFDSVPFVAADYWVLWVDEGYRTAVVGSPNGKTGWILNRDPEIPPDRLRAAREVLEFNGYDLSQLQEVSP